MDAVPAFSEDFRTPARARRDRGSGEVVCLVDTSDVPRNSVLRVWPIRGRVIRPGQEFALHPDECLKVSIADARDAGGLIVCILAPPGDGGHDITEPVQSSDGLWNICPETKARLDPTTSEPMFNRQQYPRLLELDGTLLAGKARSLLQFTPGAPVVPLELESDERFRAWVEHEDPTASRHEAHSRAACTRPAGAESGQAVGTPPWAHFFSHIQQLEGDLLSCDPTQFHERRAGLEERLASLLRSLEQYSWSFNRFCQWNEYRVEKDNAYTDLSLDVLVGTGINRMQGIREYLMTLSRLWKENFILSRQPGVPTAGTVSHPPGQPGRGGVPSISLPYIPWALTSDEDSYLFASAYEFTDYLHGLFRMDVRTGKTVRLPDHGITYGGLWFDRNDGLLYALHFLQDRTAVSGMDILDRSGKLLGRFQTTEKESGKPFSAYALSGNSDSLFFADALTRSIIFLDKTTMTPRFAFKHPLLNTPSAVSICEDVLTICDRSAHIIIDHDTSRNHTTVYSNIATYLPHKMVTSPATGNRHSICYEYEPTSPNAQKQWLCTYNASCSPLYIMPLHAKRAIDMHIMNQSQFIAIADYWEGIIMLRPKIQ